jgi:hypothetical protein
MLGAPVGDLREPIEGAPPSQESFRSDARKAKPRSWSSCSSDSGLQIDYALYTNRGAIVARKVVVPSSACAGLTGRLDRNVGVFGERQQLGLKAIGSFAAHPTEATMCRYWPAPLRRLSLRGDSMRRRKPGPSGEEKELDK